MNVPEGSIQSTRKLGGITHQATSIRVAFLDQSELDRLDASIHHITGRNEMGTSLGVRQCDFCNPIGRGGHVEMRRSVEEVWYRRVL